MVKAKEGSAVNSDEANYNAGSDANDGIDDLRDDSGNTGGTALNQEAGITGETRVAPGGMLAGNMVAASPGSSMVGGIGAGALGGIARKEAELTDDDVDNDEMNLDLLSQFGSKGGEGGSEAVSEAQRETEADELNG